MRFIEKYVDEYNNMRYHAGIVFLKPVDIFYGRGPVILAERRRKLKQARIMTPSSFYDTFDLSY